MLLTEPEDLRNMRTVVDGRDLAEQAVVAVADALLIYRRAAGLGVKGSSHQVPHVRPDRRLGLQIVDFVALADPELQESSLVDAEAITIVPVVIPAADQALAMPDVGPDRMDKGEKGKAALQRQFAPGIRRLPGTIPPG